MKFKVGDYVVMKKSADRVYSLSKYKSTGTIVEIIDEYNVLIEFDYLSTEHDEHLPRFTIEVEHCKLAKQLSQQDKVCAKIVLMEKRWKNFQERKRSCSM